MTIEEEIENALKLGSNKETIKELIAMILYYNESPTWKMKKICLDMATMILEKVGWE